MNRRPPTGIDRSSSLALSPGLLYFSHQHHQTQSSPTSIPEQPSPDPDRINSNLPPNPFSCIDSLRALDKNVTQPSSFLPIPRQSSDWSTGLNRFLLRSPIDPHPHSDPINSDPVFEDDELCWKGSKLIWSRRSLIHRTFDYSSNKPSLAQDSNPNSSGQHVIQALFAYFDPPASTPSPTAGDYPKLVSHLPTSDDREPSSTQFDATYGPSPSPHFDPTPPEPWSDNRLAQRSDRLRRWRSSTDSPVRALCVLLSEALKIYFDTGEEYTLAVPFPIQKIWPIERGVMLMKKPTSVRPRPFIPTHQTSSGASNQVKLRNVSRKSILGPDPRCSSISQVPSTSEFMHFDSMVTENETTRLWSGMSGFDLDDGHLTHQNQLADDDDEEADEREISAELARYWAERRQIESSMLWTLSDPCTHYLQPVLTTERIILPHSILSPSCPSKTTDRLAHGTPSEEMTGHNFSKAFVPLIPLVTPPRRPGSALSSGTVVYVADPKIDPLHPICITASTEGFTILLYGRLPSTFSASSGLLTPFESSSPVGIPEEELSQDDHMFLDPLRSPTPPIRLNTTDEPQLRRSPRKITASQIYPPAVESTKDTRQAPRVSMDGHKLSPTFSRSKLPPARLSGLGHPTLLRSLNQPAGNSVGSISTKKRGIHSGPATNLNLGGGRRVSVVSNASNASFAFGSAAGPSTTIHGGSNAPKSSARKSLAEQQLEMMSGTMAGHRAPITNPEKVGTALGLDREAGGGFEEWFDGIMDSEPSDRKIDGHLADEALEPEFIIQTLQTVEVPGRLTVEELPSIHATLYDSRGATAYLAVCIAAKATVYVFRLTRTLDSISIKLLGRPLEGTAIGPVLCSRSNVYDLFKFSNSTGMLEIFSADSSFIRQISHPDPIWSPERSVQPLVGSYVEFISPHPTIKHLPRAAPTIIRSDLKLWPMNPLIRKVFHVLSEDIGNVQVCDFFQRFIQYDCTFKWLVDRLEAVLLEAVTGEEVWKTKKTSVEPLDDATDTMGIIDQIEELKSDPILKHLSLQHCPGLSVHSSSFKAPGSPRKRRPHPEAGRGLPLNSESKIKLMVSLGRLYADLKTSASCVEQQLALGKILFKLSVSLGWVDWIDSLKRSFNGALDVHSADRTTPSTTKLNEPQMPNLLDHLDRIRLGIHSPFNELFEGDGDSDHNWIQAHHRSNLGFYGAQDSCRRSQQISHLYRILFKPNTVPLDSAKGILIEIDRFGWTHDDLDDLWFGIAIPLKEALRYCQHHAPHGLHPRCYQLMGRPDLCMLADQTDETTLNNNRSLARPAFQSMTSIHITSQPPPSISQLCATAAPVEDPVMPSAESYSHSLELDSANLNAAALFSDDMRIVDAAKMLNYTQEVKVIMHESIAEMTSTDVARQHSNFFVGIIRRTMSLPFGGACFWYKTDSSVAVNVPMIKLDIRISSPAILIQPDLTKVEPLGWPRFHAGVAAGLSLSVKPEEFDSSQISMARPEELEDRHAGYLLGLGLNQHLRSINRVQIFRYLETKHEMTSIGVLIGLSSAFIGSADPRVSSIIAAHVPAMHPTDSIQLQVSPLTQSAGFISFGILHLGTANRRLSDGMLREMGRTWRVLTDTSGGCRESYTLCAGLGYGLVMLGRGTESDTPAHKDLMRTFKCLIQGDGAHPLPGLNQPTMTIDVSVTSPAATLALALLYLKTGRAEVATLCEIPQTPARLEYIRPDLLMIRTLARGLIMWQSIETGLDWMQSFVPPVILEAIKLAETQQRKLKAYWEMSYWSIVAGAALSVALKYAGSADHQVHTTLLKLYDRLLKTISKPALSVQARVRRNCLRTCHNSVTLGLAIVMAGTGDLQVMKRLRLAHGNTTDTTGYGTHVVTHLALGLLFLGGGRYTLGTSNRAVACLVCALYPIFPSRSDDQVHHLQALRHLWALAVEPRCLVAREVCRKGELIFLPIELETREPPSRPSKPGRILSDGDQMNIDSQGLSDEETRSDLKVKCLTVPTLVPELSTIQSVKVESPRYWPFALDLAHNPHHRKYFSQSLSLWVKKKVGHLSYSQDPRGTQSIESRGRGAEEMMTCELDDFGVRSRDIRMAMKAKLDHQSSKTEGDCPETLHDLIGGFHLDQQSIGLVDYLGSLTRSSTKASVDRWILDLSAYSSTALLRCLREDQLEIFPTYLALFTCSNSSRRKDAADQSKPSLSHDHIPDQEWQISNLVKFYDGHRIRSSLCPSDSSCLLDRSLLTQIQHAHQEELIHWAESRAGDRLVMEYLGSNGATCVRSTSTADLMMMMANDDGDGNLRCRRPRVVGTNDEDRLMKWLKLMDVPLPRTLQALRTHLSREFSFRSSASSSSSPSRGSDPDHHQDQLMLESWVKNSFQGALPLHHQDHQHYHQFIKLLVRSCRPPAGSS